jgi:hypothetical protein
MFCAAVLFFGGAEGVGSRLNVLRARTHFRRNQGCRVPFSCLALPYSFSTEPRASGPVFMFSTPVLVFDGTKGVGSRFHVLLSRTYFRWYRGRRVPFSYFADPNSFSTAPWTSGPFFMFCASGIIFGGTEGVGSRFHVLRARTHYRQNRGHQLPNLFWAVPRASGPVFMFCALRHVFGGTEGVWSRFHVLRSRTHFRRYRGRRDPFSCFSCADSFTAVTRASGPVFMFCAPEPVFGGTKGVGSRFHVSRARTRLRR